MRSIITGLLLCAAAAAQDLPCTAILLTGDSTEFGDTSTLSPSLLQQSCASGSTSSDAWYTFTAIASGPITATTCGPGSDYDTALALFGGPDCSTLTELACNDDDPTCSSSIRRSTLTHSLTAGTTYWLRVTGFNGAEGNYELTVSADPAVWQGGNAAPTLSMDGSAPNLPTCSLVNIPTGLHTPSLEMATAVPNSPVILAAAYFCVPGNAYTGTTNSFDLDYNSLLWLVDGTGSNLMGPSSFWNLFAVTDSNGRFLIAGSTDFQPGPVGSFQGAVMDPSTPFGLDLSQALIVEAI